MESGDCLSLRMAVNCFFLSIGLYTKTPHFTQNSPTMVHTAPIHVPTYIPLTPFQNGTLSLNQLSCPKDTIPAKEMTKSIHTPRSLNYLCEVFLEQECCVELQVFLSACDDSSDHVERSTVVLTPQFSQSLVTMKIFTFSKVTHSIRKLYFFT